jgi:WD40 repeat protein
MADPHLKLIATLAGHSSEVLALAAAPGVLASASRDRTARLWSLPGGEPLALLEGHRGAVHGAAWLPDGAALATASADMTVRLWAKRGSAWQAAATYTGHLGAVEAVAAAPDGATLAAGWNMWSYGHITLWDVLSGAERTALQTAHGQLVFGLAFAPHADRLAAALAAGFVGLWDAGQPAGLIRAHGEAVRAVAWSPDGDMLATAGSDGALRLWSMPDGEPLATLKGHEGAVFDAAFSPDGALLASAGQEGALRLWDVAARRAVGVTQAAGPLRALAWTGGATLAAGGGQGTIGLWEV